SHLGLSNLVQGRKSGRKVPHSKTLSLKRPPGRGSWSQCKRKSERRLSKNQPTPDPSQEGSNHSSRVSHHDRGFLDHFVPQRGVVVLGPAADRQNAFASAGWLALGLEHLYGVLPGEPAGRLRLRALPGDAPEHSPTNRGPRMRS